MINREEEDEVADDGAGCASAADDDEGDDGGDANNVVGSSMHIFDLVSSFLGPTTAAKSSTTVPSPTCTPPPRPLVASKDVAPSLETTSSEEESAVVVIFSKDRPWQLQQLLRSTCLFYAVDDDSSSRSCSGTKKATNKACMSNIEIVVIVRITSPEYASGYQLVQDQFESLSDSTKVSGMIATVRFEYEGVDDDCGGGAGPTGQNYSCSSSTVRGYGARLGSSFPHILERAVGVVRATTTTSTTDASSALDGKEAYDCHKNNEDQLVMFLTDDCILLEPILHILACARYCLLLDGGSSRRVLAFLSRLHPGISWCQTQNVPCPRPRTMRYVQTTGREGNYMEGAAAAALLFHRKDGTHDWSYPFDLSGGVYRASDVVGILRAIRLMDDTPPEHVVVAGARGGSLVPPAPPQHEDNGKDSSSSALGYSHPNRLEVNGNIALSKLLDGRTKSPKRTAAASAFDSSDVARSHAAEYKVQQQEENNSSHQHQMWVESLSRKDMLACPSRPSVLILAISRVQDVYSAPVCTGDNDQESLGRTDADDADASSTNGEDLSLLRSRGAAATNNDDDMYRYGDPLALLRLLHRGRHLDIDRYRSTIFNASHVGHVVLQSSADTNPPSAAQQDPPPGHDGGRTSSKSTDDAADGKRGRESEATAHNIRGVNKDKGNIYLSRKPALSVLLPIHNGPPSAARHALASILLQVAEDGGPKTTTTMTTTTTTTTTTTHSFQFMKSKLQSDDGPTPAHADDEGGENSREGMSICPLQVVIVDDRCSDGSVDACIDTAKEICYEYQLHIDVRDHRYVQCPIGEKGGAVLDADHLPTQDILSSNLAGVRNHSIPTSFPADEGETVNPRISPKHVQAIIDVVRSPKPGVGPALNFGLSFCKSDFVARMDADDISYVGRLTSQLNTLQNDTSTNVLGTCSVLFYQDERGPDSALDCVNTSANNSTASDDSQQSCTLPYDYEMRNPTNANPPTTLGYIIKPSICPSDAGFMSWSLLFSCCISHPSVMYRRSTIFEEFSGYDETISCAEDYDLWLRLTASDCRSLRCQPQFGLWHLKHPGSSSRRNLDEQRRQANVAAWKHIVALLEEYGQSTTDDTRLHFAPITLSCVASLRRPDSAQTSSAIDEAARLLIALEESFVRKHSVNLTKRELELIRLDCNARLGDLALCLVEKFGRAAAIGSSDNKGGAWDLWCKRCPDSGLQRLSLLCHYSKS